jgi:hypothetical protein
MNKIQETMKTQKFKHFLYVALAVLLIGWVAFRFASVAAENSRYVFNASRVAADRGTSIEVIEMKRTDGVLYEPLAVQNNRAYVTGARASKLRSGQKLGNGKIVSVSSGLDYDTGMYVIRTSGVGDGLHFAEFSANGYFVPLYAVSNNSVMVVDNGVASARSVQIVRQDSENAYITTGLNDGDMVILTTVNAGDKVQIKE